MIARQQYLFTGIAIFMFACAASAQICKETSANSSNIFDADHSGIDCDMTYRDKVITCDYETVYDDTSGIEKSRKTRGTRPACPSKPMPMIKTPLASYIKDYSPYLFAYARDEHDPTKAYNGNYAVGTQGDASQVFGMVTTAAGNGTRLANCVSQLSFPAATSVEEEAKQVRLQLDNCTNQYILYDSIYPSQKSRSRLIDDPEVSGLPITLATDCQPLQTFPEAENEYKASEYLEAAWKKLMQDPNYRKNSLAFAEPHLPKGITFKNPIAPPSPFPDVRLSQIAMVHYEQIVDPSHPFSPRWDFSFNERDRYSPLTSQYMTKTDNSVYCAGAKDAGNETDQKKKDDLTVKVDVLKFRQDAFQSGILKRIGYNTLCKNSKGDSSHDKDIITGLATSYCADIDLTALAACVLSGTSCSQVAQPLSCWECYNLNGKVDDSDGNHPPCATRYDGEDQSMQFIKSGHPTALPGLFNAFREKATCNPVPVFTSDDKNDITKLCSDLRKPYTQLNKLKMRYHNPDDKDYNALKDGVPEGYTFKEYFGNHMPYPRLWDTGTALQKTPSADSNFQEPQDTIGQYTAIVGIGREGATAKTSDDDQKKHKDERCKIGGWGDSDPLTNGSISNSLGGGADGGLSGFTSQLSGGIGSLLSSFDFLKDSFGSSSPVDISSVVEGLTGPTVKFSGVTIHIPDPVTSWTELKLYQTHTMRTANLSCLGRYEKVFKPGGAENIALGALGGEWSRVIVEKCPADKSSPCTYITLDEYKTQGAATGYYYHVQTMLESIPLSWRGYMATGTDPNNSIANIVNPLTGGDPDQFPNFGNSSPGNVVSNLLSSTTATGLDNAQLGDIVMMPRGASGDGRKPGLPKVAFIAEVSLKSDCATLGGCYVKVFESDNGKWPDTCGTTDTNADLKSRYYYKPGFLPKVIQDEYTKIHSTMNCEDPKLAQCAFEPWNNVKLYRIRNDTRNGCDKVNAADCK